MAGIWRRIVLALCVAGAMAVLPSCASEGQDGSQASGKTVVTMLHYSGMSEFEALVESTYDDIDLQPERTTTATMSGDLERRLRAGHGPDLLVTLQPMDGDFVQYAADLSSYAFSASYADTLSDSLTVEGRTYCLPLPGQYYGYTVNKTLLDQEGIALPTTEQELVEALVTLKERGVGVGEDGANFGIQVVDAVALGNYVAGTMVPDFLGTPDGVAWLESFESGDATFAGTWDSAFDELMLLVERECIAPNSISGKSNVMSIEPRMGKGELAAAYGNSTLLANSRKSNEDAVQNEGAAAYEYVTLPFFSKAGNNAWTLTSPAAYIGINGTLAQDGADAAKLDACRRVLELLSTPEGQQAFVDDTGTDMTYLKEAKVDPSNTETGLEPYIEKGYVYDMKFPGKVIEYLGHETAQVVAGAATVEEGLRTVDDYYRNGSQDVEYDLSVVGSVSHDLLYEGYNVRLGETELGNLLTDSIAELTGAPIAVANGGGIRASLYEGDVHGSDLSAMCPYDNKIVVLDMSGKTLEAMLENGLAQWDGDPDAVPGGRFLQVSGLKYEFEPNEDGVGASLAGVTLADGSAVDPDARYTVAVNDYMAGSGGYLDKGGDGYTMLNVYSDTAPLAEDVSIVKELDSTYADALKAYFETHKDDVINPILEGRIVQR